MMQRWFLVVFLALSLAACGSSQKKEESAAVEDHSGAGQEGPQSYGAGDASRGKFSELEDPNSPLSIRVIYFDYDSSDVRAEFRGVVEAHASFLAAHPDVTISLEGHADERGSREYNLALGERRSQSVKRQMTVLGASGNQMRTTSYGEERPVVEGHDEYSWAQNRRVEIIY